MKAGRLRAGPALLGGSLGLLPGGRGFGDRQQVLPDLQLLCLPRLILDDGGFALEAGFGLLGHIDLIILRRTSAAAPSPAVRRSSRPVLAPAW